MGFIFSGLISLVILVLDIWVIVNILKSVVEIGMKIIWVLVIIVLLVFGLIIWVIVGLCGNVRLQFFVVVLVVCGVVVLQVDCGVGVLRLLGFGVGFQVVCIDVLWFLDCGFQQVEVGGGEGVGFVYGMQGYVFGGLGVDVG